ncbi:uncharacterized protein KQ657_001194 [Scheffersomyces spartinae]|uniref:DUF4259 domain-containing protein n=1 Tax=Scheffersomyces spartinae TaxID=45513 RepID=A0A9P8AHS3_9ASCO|nr:uncharacterized protein KQ657_001194 [Scheffersomyces spartinae]KAG7193077.1 hypothetical protein KQ657_001194 [Scheffersomyces spartinae]
MGAWGHEIFDSDSSCDYISRFLEAKSPEQFYSFITEDLEELFSLSYIEGNGISVIGYLVGRLSGDELVFANVKDYWKEKIDPVIGDHKPMYQEWVTKTKIEGHSIDETILLVFSKLLLNGDVSEEYELWAETEYFQAWFNYYSRFVTYYESKSK